ncbi:MAG: alpha/beta hydrolase [Bacteroidota bacterium]
MPNKTIYAIPGLGVDERIFYDLELEAKMVYLNWIDPRPHDSASSYARRLAEKIEHEEDCILMGLSFGGVMAQEIARIRPVKKMILLSTMKSSAEKPFQMAFMRHIPLYYLSKGNWRVEFFAKFAPIFGIEDEADIALIKDMFLQFDDAYRMWAIKTICGWEGEEPQLPYIHIHGNKDKVFPISNIKEPVVVKGGNHYMVKQRAKEISELINHWLDTI